MDRDKMELIDYLINEGRNVVLSKGVIIVMNDSEFAEFMETLTD